MTTAHPNSSHLAAYADGELERRAQRATERHVGRCGECRAEVAEQRALSSALQAFALPEGLGAQTWERVKGRLPATLLASEPSGGFLRWAPPVAVFSATAMLQAIPIMAVALTALSGLGFVNVRQVVSTWLPADSLLGRSLLQQAVDLLISSPLLAPLSHHLAALIERWGSDVALALSWLVPSALAFLASAVLALLYLGWLAACWNRSAQQARNVS